MVKKKKNLVVQAKKTVSIEVPLPLEAIASCSRTPSTGVRQNAAAVIPRNQRYANIEQGVIPFVYQGGGDGKYTSTISMQDAIILCQKAYWNFSIFRNTIDLMTEFTVTPIRFQKGNAQSRKFFEEWASKVNLWKLQDKFYREYYRSGNVFLYRLKATLDQKAMLQINKILGQKNHNAKASVDLPVQYILLNPADIQTTYTASFLNGVYYKVLNPYEVAALLNPQTEEDKELANKIPEIAKMKKGGRKPVLLPLIAEDVAIVFYKKQDYEGLAVPMGFSVLEDINWKAELKKIDMAISRTLNQAVLLITMGDEKTGSTSVKNMDAMREIFQNESVGRVLVADYTTKAQFIIPDLKDILTPEKYKIVDQDIRLGLNNVLFGDEKFANVQTKIDIFMARLKYARNAFLQEFLYPEIRAIAKKLNFKNVPIPVMDEIDFKPDILKSRLYAQFAQLGVLTPDELLEAMKTGHLPEPEDSVAAQEKFKEQKDAGLYQPIVGKGNAESGRPEGSSSPQTTKAPGKIGVEKASQTFSCNSMKDTVLASESLIKWTEKKLKRKYKAKDLTLEQKSIAHSIAEVIMGNEVIDNWNESIARYLEHPVGENTEMQNEINEIVLKHNLDLYSATLLYHARIK